MMVLQEPVAVILQKIMRFEMLLFAVHCHDYGKEQWCESRVKERKSEAWNIRAEV